VGQDLVPNLELEEQGAPGGDKTVGKQGQLMRAGGEGSLDQGCEQAALAVKDLE